MVDNMESENLGEKELKEIDNLIYIYYDISKKILNENNISPTTKFVLGELLGKIFYKMNLIGDLIYYKKLDNEKLENVEKILNYLNENFAKLDNEKLENVEKFRNELRNINSDFDWFMGKLIFNFI